MFRLSQYKMVYMQMFLKEMDFGVNFTMVINAIFAAGELTHGVMGSLKGVGSVLQVH